LLLVYARQSPDRWPMELQVPGIGPGFQVHYTTNGTVE
jgi:hypothetical protein